MSLGRWRYIASAACFLYVVVSLGAPTLFLVLGSFMRRYGFFQIRDPFTLERWKGCSPIQRSSARCATR